MTHPESLRRRAKQLRATKTQREIAQLLGVSQYTVWSWFAGKAGRERQRKKNSLYRINLVSEVLYLGTLEVCPVDYRRGHVELIWHVNRKTRRRIGFAWNIHHYEEGDRQSAHSLAIPEWDGAGIVFADEDHRTRFAQMWKDGSLIREVPT